MSRTAGIGDLVRPPSGELLGQPGEGPYDGIAAGAVDVPLTFKGADCVSGARVTVNVLPSPKVGR